MAASFEAWSAAGRSGRRALTLVEILVVMGILLVILSLALPAITAAREMARRGKCANNLRQFGVAIREYESAHGALPAGRDATSGFDHSWATAILPHLEQTPLFKLYDYNHAWNDSVAGAAGVSNSSVASAALPIFVCPSTHHDNPAGVTDYGGNYGSSLSGLSKGFGDGLAWDSGTLLALNTASQTSPQTSPARLEDVTDGTSQTFLVMEDSGRQPNQGGSWADGNNCLAHEYSAINISRLQGIYSDHPGGANMVMVDSSVRFMTNDTDKYVLGAYSTRANNDWPVPPGG